MALVGTWPSGHVALVGTWPSGHVALGARSSSGQESSVLEGTRPGQMVRNLALAAVELVSSGRGPLSFFFSRRKDPDPGEGTQDPEGGTRDLEVGTWKPEAGVISSRNPEVKARICEIGISIDTLVETSTDYSIGISIDALGQALIHGLNMLTKLPRSALALL
ncbi:hypothetical protein F2Q70_00017548 [Brassica cretica]|uniref:Uncharacterized protein n=1 Tax=Brassica cretica TaxID=69181 RepID=A0A8S9KZI5_BRACR|nr:hypothetical protein F2Q70_00017548 [Brassica cretica]KAF2599895.1 hypothetical protein F2Q68_00010571 [Brassica cretica]